MKTLFTFSLVFFLSGLLYAQTVNVSGKVTAIGKVLEKATVSLKGTAYHTLTDSAGNFSFSNLQIGKYTIAVSAVGYLPEEESVTLTENFIGLVNVEMIKTTNRLDEVVVTGTRTPKRRINSPVIVNLINSKTLDKVVAVNLSEGLKYQTGVRVETDCQTCSYTQLRINGLQGGYSQILVNSRQIFSPLMGLYGMEQIPVNMIDRIEVVRGGVSALYGSSAIGGTVNIITKVPTENTYDITNTFQRIKGQTSDNILSGNLSMVNEKKTAGFSLFVNNRNREHYDANGDNFSELPQLKDNSFGTNIFLVPGKGQKLQLSLSSINEYRFGGENVKKAAYLALQSEERTHNIIMGSADYSIELNEKNTLAIYYGGQKTDRKHYTGIIPDDFLEQQAFFANPPYGTSDVVTHQGGVQMNNKFNKFLGGQTTLTTGIEYISDAVFDEIEAYNYKVDQTTTNLGMFVQNDWDVTKSLNLLTGFRADKHNLVDHVIVSPRVSLLYKLQKNTQFRLGWGTGFRAPQAFDTDLHIAFAAGGVSRISLAKGLKEEKSNSFTASVNYDKASEHIIAGFTVEGFYTNLRDAFFQFPLGEDQFGKIFQKRNGDGATVKGITLEARANFDYVVEVDAGFTIQSSKFNVPVDNINGLPAKREYLKTPNHYGFATVIINPTKNWNVALNGVYTGTMLLAHFAGAGTGQDVNEYYTSRSFTDVGIRVGHTFDFKTVNTGIEIFGGMKNIFDAYQSNFDLGKNRDSNFIYGPNMPRSVFIGLRLKSIKGSK